MLKTQVRYLLGDPNANSPFQKNQWIYIYTNQLNYLPRSESKLILTFKGDKLVKLSLVILSLQRTNLENKCDA